VSKKTKLLLFMIVASLLLTNCSKCAPCPQCPTIVVPEVQKQEWNKLEVEYERIR